MSQTERGILLYNCNPRRSSFFSHSENQIEKVKISTIPGEFGQKIKDLYSDEVIFESGEFRTNIRAESRYTLDSPSSFILDRLAARSVKQEHQTLIENLIKEVNAN